VNPNGTMTRSTRAEQRSPRATVRSRRFGVVIAALFVAYGCGRSTSREHEGDASGSGGEAGADVTPPTGGVESGGSSGASTGGLGGTNPSGGRGGTGGSGAVPGGTSNRGGAGTGGASVGGTAGSGGRGGSAGAGGVNKRNGERCVANAECLSRYCYSDAPDAGILPPRTCRDCLYASAYALWCDEDADCCQGLTCGFGERAGVCITP
jgi:hypothetical protein